MREGLADHPEVELVGTAADTTKAGTKLAESGAQVILHGTTATDHVPTAEIEAIRGVVSSSARPCCWTSTCSSATPPS